MPYNNILKLFLHEIKLFLLVSVLHYFGYHFLYVALVAPKVPSYLLDSLRTDSKTL